ncbi:MAG: hypothetical protein II794_03335, partial [Oscillospiraceae bacterium]|nr:hypothetical protein [Oscillospiraceae bacterium]
MKRILIVITAFALMLSLWSCAPAAKDDINSKPGGSPVPDSAPASGETPYVPEPADPEPTPNKPAPIEEANKTEPEDKYILLSSKFSQFVDSPIVLPKNYKPEIFEEAPAPETADGLYFGCRGANIYLTPEAGYFYSFYIISRSPIKEESFKFDSGLASQQT